MRMRFEPAIALAIFGIAGLAAGSLGAATGGITKGELALKMARAAGINLPATGSRQAAAEALRRSGIDLGTDLAAPATEQTLVQAGRALGASVTTSRPDAPVTPGVGQAFVQSIKNPLRIAAAASGQNGTSVTHASCQGRESRAGRRGTPASPADPNATATPCEEPIP